MTTHKMANNVVDVKLILSALWVARMLTGFVGDVLKFYEPGMAAQILAGAVDGMSLTPGFLLAAAITFVIPVFMAYLSLILPYKANRWANIIVAALFFGLNLVGELPTYEYAYRTFLVIVEMVFLGLIVWTAWKWSNDYVPDRFLSEYSPGKGVAKNLSGFEKKDGRNDQRKFLNHTLEQLSFAGSRNSYPDLYCCCFFHFDMVWTGRLDRPFAFRGAFLTCY